MGETELTVEARTRLHAMIDEQLDRLRGLLKVQADAILAHSEAVAYEAAARHPAGDPNRVYNRKEVAELLSCSEGTVDNLVRRGELKFTRRWLGGPKCFTFEQVNEYVERLNKRGEDYAKLGRKKE